MNQSAEIVEGSDIAEEKEVKTFTQVELDKIVKERVFRQKEKLREEYEEKYGRLETVLKAGLGTDSLEDATRRMTEFYTEQGVNIPQMRLTAREEEILANAEVRDIIEDGYEEIVSVTDKLAHKGLENMSPKEKLMFTKLAQERSKQESLKELARLGVGGEVLEDKDFQEFMEKLNPNLSIKEKYELFENLKPKKKIEIIGSMKTGTSKEQVIKDFYTIEEARRFTREDLDKNPKLMEAIEKSMTKWK